MVQSTGFLTLRTDLRRREVRSEDELHRLLVPQHYGPAALVGPGLALPVPQWPDEADHLLAPLASIKATEPTGLPITGRMNGKTAEYYSDPDTHLGRLVAYAWQLGTLPESHIIEQQKTDWHDTYGRLRRWTTCSASAATSPPSPAATPPPTKHLRAARREYQRSTRVDWREGHPVDSWSTTDDDTTLILCDLTLAGIGWNTTADAQLATAAAARAREHRAALRENRTTA